MVRAQSMPQQMVGPLFVLWTWPGLSLLFPRFSHTVLSTCNMHLLCLPGGTPLAFPRPGQRVPPYEPSRHFPQLNAVYHVLGKWYYKSYISDEIREGGKKSLKGCKIKSRPWRRSELTPDRRHVTHKRRLVHRAACTLSSIYCPPREHYH